MMNYQKTTIVWSWAATAAMFLGGASAVTPAFADEFQVIKAFPDKPQIIVNQGVEAGFEKGKRVDIILKSGKRIPLRVSKGVAGKSLVAIPAQYQGRIKQNAKFTFELASGDPERSTASMTGDMSHSGSSSRSAGKSSVKALVGMAGANMNSGIIVFGADYVFPVGKQFSLAPGVTYWSLAGGVETGDSWSFMTIDVAAGYHIPVSRQFELEVGGRLGVGRSAYSYPAVGILPAEEGSAMAMLITPYANAGYAISKSMDMGFEARLPLAGSSDIGTSMFYALGFVKFAL